MIVILGILKLLSLDILIATAALGRSQIIEKENWVVEVVSKLE